LTPQEQIEELARKWEQDADVLEGLAPKGTWVNGASTARREDANQLRALLPLEVTDESPLRVTVDTADLIELLYGATTDSPANRKARTRLRAALTQKGDNE